MRFNLACLLLFVLLSMGCHGSSSASTSAEIHGQRFSFTTPAGWSVSQRADGVVGALQQGCPQGFIKLAPQDGKSRMNICVSDIPDVPTKENLKATLASRLQEINRKLWSRNGQTYTTASLEGGASNAYRINTKSYLGSEGTVQASYVLYPKKDHLVIIYMWDVGEPGSPQRKVFDDFLASFKYE